MLMKTSGLVGRSSIARSMAWKKGLKIFELIDGLVVTFPPLEVLQS